MPRNDGQTAYHDTVADLVLEAVQGRKQTIEIVEWPGGQPQQINLDVSFDVFKGRVSIPL